MMAVSPVGSPQARTKVGGYQYSPQARTKVGGYQYSPQSTTKVWGTNPVLELGRR